MQIRGYQSQSKLMVNQINKAANNIAHHSARISSGDSFKGKIDNPSYVIRASRAEAQMRGNLVAERNIQDGIAFLDVKDAALDKMESIGHRLRELSTEYHDATKSIEELEVIKEETRTLIAEMRYTKDNTTYNDKDVFGSFDILIQAGDKTGDKLAIKPSGFNLNNLETPPNPSYDSTKDNIELALNPDFIDSYVLEPIANDRAYVATERNRMEIRMESVTNEAVQAETELNRVRDTDIAKEVMALTKEQLLTDVNTKFLTQSLDQHRQQVLSLIM